MNLPLWIILYFGSTAFVWWVVWGGAAAWFQGWRSWLLVDWFFAYEWNSEQIALHTLVCWVGYTLWFILGVFVPEARTIFW